MVAFSGGALGAMAAGAKSSSSFWGPVAASAVGNIVGGLFGGDDNRNGPSRKYYARQAQFNQDMLNRQHDMNMLDAVTRPAHLVHGARKAGVHPALLFGGSVMGSPSFTIAGSPSPTSGGGSSMGYHMAQLGQDISRAYMADMSLKERRMEVQAAQERAAKIDALNLARHESDVTESQLRNVNTGLQNDLLRLQIQKMSAPGTPPPRPTNTMGGVNNHPVGPTSGAYTVKPAEVVASHSRSPSQEAGPARPGFMPVRIGRKFVLSLPNSATSEALESMGAVVSSPLVLGHNVGLRIDRLMNKPTQTAPAGTHWAFDKYVGDWVTRPNPRPNRYLRNASHVPRRYQSR